MKNPDILFIIILTTFRKARNLLNSIYTPYIYDQELLKDNIKDITHAELLKVMKVPKPTSQTMMRYVNMMREKQNIVQTLMRYVTDETLIDKTPMTDIIYNKYFEYKDCNIIELHIGKNYLSISIPYKVKYLNDINKAIKNYNLQNIKVDSTNKNTVCTIDKNQKYDIKNILFIFRIISELMKECKGKYSIINIGERIGVGHRTQFIVNKLNYEKEKELEKTEEKKGNENEQEKKEYKKNVLEFFYYNPHGGAYTSNVEELRQILEINNQLIDLLYKDEDDYKDEKEKNERIKRMQSTQYKEYIEKLKNKYHEYFDSEKELFSKTIFKIFTSEVSCDIGLQAKANDKIGLCVAFSIFWYDNVLAVLSNIERYNKINNLNIQLPLSNWIKLITDVYNDIDNAIKVKEGTNIRNLNNDELFEMIVNYTYSLYSLYKLKISHEESLKFEEYVQKDISSVNKIKMIPLPSGGYKKVKFYGQHSLHLYENNFDTDNFLTFDKPDENLPLEISDMEMLKLQEEMEHNMINNITKGDYLKRCKQTTDCNEKYNMMCDIIDTENNIGNCIPDKKFIGQTCRTNDDCLSDNCDNGMCRIDYDNKLKLKLVKQTSI